MQITLKLDKKLFDVFDIAVAQTFNIEIKEVKEEPGNDFLVTIEYENIEDLFKLGLKTGLGKGQKQPIIIGGNRPERYEKYIINN